MQESDFKKVTFFIELKARLEEALEANIRFRDDAELERNIDSGGLPNFDQGFWAAVSTHKDGSGQRVDLSGCYVGLQLSKALEEVLETQLLAVNIELKGLGVELTGALEDVADW